MVASPRATARRYWLLCRAVLVGLGTCAHRGRSLAGHFIRGSKKHGSQRAFERRSPCVHVNRQPQGGGSFSGPKWTYHRAHTVSAVSGPRSKSRIGLRTGVGLRRRHGVRTRLVEPAITGRPGRFIQGTGGSDYFGTEDTWARHIRPGPTSGEGAAKHLGVRADVPHGAVDPLDVRGSGDRQWRSP